MEKLQVNTVAEVSDDALSLLKSNRELSSLSHNYITDRSINRLCLSVYLSPEFHQSHNLQLIYRLSLNVLNSIYILDIKMTKYEKIF